MDDKGGRTWQPPCTGRAGLAPARGRGVDKDKAVAADYFRRAAILGDSEGAYRLGEAYAVGQGVVQDFAQAANWFQRAAFRDHAKAAFRLAQLYATGRGVERSPELAAMWMDISAHLGDSDAIAAIK